MNLLAPVVEGMIVRTLRRVFRRVCWVGAAPALPPQTPVVLYANHHNFFDGYLTGLLVRRVLRRPFLVWMEDWDRFPFFGAVGALPFPPDDAARRAATLRHTVRRFRAAPETTLVYFPEGRLHRAEEGILPFDADALARLDRLLPDKVWWPVGLYAAWWNDALPTALLGGGAPHTRATGEEQARLESVWQAVRTAGPDATQTLCEGRRSPHEARNLSFLRRFFAPRS